MTNRKTYILTYIDDEIYTQVPEGTEASASQRQHQGWKWFDGRWWIPVSAGPRINWWTPKSEVEEPEVTTEWKGPPRWWAPAPKKPAFQEHVTEHAIEYPYMPIPSKKTPELTAFENAVYNSGYALTEREHSIARYFWGKANDCP